MNKLTISLLAATALSAQATVIPIDLGPPRRVPGDVFVTSDALDGTAVNGQTLSLDYQFSGYVRLFPYTTDGFYFAILAQTNAQPIAGLSEYPSVVSSGYAIGINGYQGPTSIWLGGGIWGLNVTEILFGDTIAIPHTDIYPHSQLYLTSLHFDLTLPDMEGIEITGATNAHRRLWRSPSQRLADYLSCAGHRHDDHALCYGSDNTIDNQ